MSKQYQADVVVVGAGPSGSAAAAFLAEAGIKVILVDRARFPRDKVCGDAVSGTAEAILDVLGLLSWAEERRFARFRGFLMTSPDGTAVTTQRSQKSPYGGCLIPRKVLDAKLVQSAVARGATLWEETRISALEPIGPSLVRLRGRQDKSTVTSDVLRQTSGSQADPTGTGFSMDDESGPAQLRS